MSLSDRCSRSRVVVPRPDRVRHLADAPFGWLDARLHRGGFLRSLSSEDLAVYTFLCIVADRSGVSFYRKDRIGLELGLDATEVRRILSRLQQLDLVAFEPFHSHAPDGFLQVLSLPSHTPSCC